MDITLRDSDGIKLSVNEMKEPIKMNIGKDVSYGEQPSELPIDLLISRYKSYFIDKEWSSFHLNLIGRFEYQYLILIGYDALPQLKEPKYYEHYRIIPNHIGETNAFIFY